MNIKQRLIIVAGTLAIILLSFWPPCKPNGLGWEFHRFIFDMGGYHIYWTKFLTYAGLVVFIDLGLVWALSSRK